MKYLVEGTVIVKFKVTLEAEAFNQEDARKKVLRGLSEDDYREWNAKALQAGWAKLQYESWETFSLQNWFGFTSDTNHITSEQANNEIISERPKRKKPSSTSVSGSSVFDWQENESPLPGVDDGLPDGVDRNKSLGNAIVPSCVYPILKSIALIEALKHA